MGCISQAMQDGLYDMEGPPGLICVLRQPSVISLAFCKEFPLAACKSLWKKIWFLPTLEETSSSSVPPLTASHSLSRCLYHRTFHWEEATWTGTETRRVFLMLWESDSVSMEGVLRLRGNWTDRMAFRIWLERILAIAQPPVLMLNGADSCHRLFPDIVFIQLLTVCFFPWQSLPMEGIPTLSVGFSRSHLAVR